MVIKKTFGVVLIFFFSILAAYGSDVFEPDLLGNSSVVHPAGSAVQMKWIQLDDYEIAFETPIIYPDEEAELEFEYELCDDCNDSFLGLSVFFDGKGTYYERVTNLSADNVFEYLLLMPEDEGDYELLIVFVFEEYNITYRYDFIVDKDIFRISADLDIFDDVSAGDIFEIEVEMANSGTLDFDEVYVTLSIPVLGFKISEKKYDFDMGGDWLLDYKIAVPEDVVGGTHRAFLTIESPTGNYHLKKNRSFIIDTKNQTHGLLIARDIFDFEFLNSKVEFINYSGRELRFYEASYKINEESISLFYFDNNDTEFYNNQLDNFLKNFNLLLPYGFEGITMMVNDLQSDQNNLIMWETDDGIYFMVIRGDIVSLEDLSPFFSVYFDFNTPINFRIPDWYKAKLDIRDIYLGLPGTDSLAGSSSCAVVDFSDTYYYYELNFMQDQVGIISVKENEYDKLCKDMSSDYDFIMLFTWDSLSSLALGSTTYDFIMGNNKDYYLLPSRFIHNSMLAFDEVFKSRFCPMIAKTVPFFAANAVGLGSCFAENSGVPKGFDGDTTNFNNISDPDFVSNLVFEKSTDGKIEFIGGVDLTGINNMSVFSEFIRISNAFVSIDTTMIPQLKNRSAVLTLKGLEFETPRILLDGVECTECKILSYSGGVLKFIVPHFSTYSIVEEDEPEAIYLKRFRALDEQVRPGDDIRSHVSVENMDVGTITIVIPELGVRKKVRIDDGDDFERIIAASVPEDAEPGIYTVRATIYDIKDNRRRIVHREIEVY